MSAIRRDARTSLHFPPDVEWMRTPFRDRALNHIYKIALDLSEGRVECAAVSVSGVPGEEDSLTLGLTMTINADWEFIRKLRYGILVRVGEWTRDLPDMEQEDYGRRVYFSLIPSSL